MTKTIKELTEMAARWQQAPGNEEFFSLGEITSFCDHFAAGIQRLIKEVDATEFNYEKVCEGLRDVKAAAQRRAEFWENELNKRAEEIDRLRGELTKEDMSSGSTMASYEIEIASLKNQVTELLSQRNQLLQRQVEWKRTDLHGVPHHGGLVLVAGGLAFYGDASQCWKSGNGPDYGRPLEWTPVYWAEIPRPPIGQ